MLIFGFQKYQEMITAEPEVGTDQPYPPEYLEVFESLWNDSGVQQAIHRGNEYALHDNLS